MLKFPTLPWKSFTNLKMNLVGELPVASRGLQEYLTKYIQIFPIALKDAVTIAASLVYVIFYQSGFPKKHQINVKCLPSGEFRLRVFY
jgi:hypothetical protein